LYLLEFGFILKMGAFHDAKSNPVKQALKDHLLQLAAFLVRHVAQGLLDVVLDLEPDH